MTKADATRAVRNAIRREGLVIPKTFSEVHCGGHVITVVDGPVWRFRPTLTDLPGVERVSGTGESTRVFWEVQA